MLKAYVIGPYRAKTHYEVQQNIEVATRVAARLWGLGYAVFCPHMNSAHFSGAAPEKNFLVGGLAWLQHADVAVVLPYHGGSEGSRAEIELCLSQHIKLFYLGRGASVWEALLNYVREYEKAGK